MFRNNQVSLSQTNSFPKTSTESETKTGGVTEVSATPPVRFQHEAVGGSAFKVKRKPLASGRQNSVHSYETAVKNNINLKKEETAELNGPPLVATAETWEGRKLYQEHVDLNDFRKHVSETFVAKDTLEVETMGRTPCKQHEQTRRIENESSEGFISENQEVDILSMVKNEIVTKRGSEIFEMVLESFILQREAYREKTADVLPSFKRYLASTPTRPSVDVNGFYIQQMTKQAIRAITVRQYEEAAKLLALALNECCKRDNYKISDSAQNRVSIGDTTADSRVEDVPDSVHATMIMRTEILLLLAFVNSKQSDLLGTKVFLDLAIFYCPSIICKQQLAILFSILCYDKGYYPHEKVLRRPYDNEKVSTYESRQDGILIFPPKGAVSMEPKDEKPEVMRHDISSFGHISKGRDVHNILTDIFITRSDMLGHQIMDLLYIEFIRYALAMSTEGDAADPGSCSIVRGWCQRIGRSGRISTLQQYVHVMTEHILSLFVISEGDKVSISARWPSLNMFTALTVPGKYAFYPHYTGKNLAENYLGSVHSGVYEAFLTRSATWEYRYPPKGYLPERETVVGHLMVYGVFNTPLPVPNPVLNQRLGLENSWLKVNEGGVVKMYARLVPQTTTNGARSFASVHNIETGEIGFVWDPDTSLVLLAYESILKVIQFFRENQLFLEEQLRRPGQAPVAEAPQKWIGLGEVFCNCLNAVEDHLVKLSPSYDVDGNLRKSRLICPTGTCDGSNLYYRFERTPKGIARCLVRRDFHIALQLARAGTFSRDLSLLLDITATSNPAWIITTMYILGIDLNRKLPPNGDTVLQTAVLRWLDREEIVELLLRYGVDVNMPISNPASPLLCVSKREEIRLEDIERKLGFETEKVKTKPKRSGFWKSREHAMAQLQGNPNSEAAKLMAEQYNAQTEYLRKLLERQIIRVANQKSESSIVTV